MAAKDLETEREGTEPRAKLTCSICLNAYKEPKVLPCCHTFCRTCLEGLAAKTEGKFKCPECRTEHDIPDRGVECFLTDFSLGREVESKESGGKEAVCGECEGGERAVAYCHDCEAFVCEGCKLSLHKAKRYRNHFIQSLSEEISYTREQGTSDLACPHHPPEKQQAYCKTCQCLVCIHCVVEKHQEHKLGPIDDKTRREVEGNLTKQKEQAEAQKTNFEQHMRHIESVEQLVSGRPEKVKQAINTAIDANIELLESRRKTLLEKVESRHEADMKNIWSQKEHVAMVTAGLKSALSFSERVLQCSSNPELLSLAPQASSRLGELHSLTWEPGELNHIKKTSIHFTCEELSPSLRTFGSLQETLMETTESIEGLALKMDLGRSVELEIVEKDAQGSVVWSTHTSCDVTVEYGRKRKVKHIQPRLSPQGRWMVTFTPVCGGSHRVSVCRSFYRKCSAETVVTGLPPVGCEVVRGPDYSYKGDHDEPFTIEEHYNPPTRSNSSDKLFSIGITTKKAEEDVVYLMQWGDNGGEYDVELVADW